MESLKGRAHLEDLNVDGSTVLKDMALKDANWISIQIVIVSRCCEYGNEPSGSINGGELLDCQLLKNCVTLN
jgi:hypothetical protein